MKRVIFLCFLFPSAHTQAQKSKLECVKSPDQFTLFVPQIKSKSQPVLISEKEKFLEDTVYLLVDKSKEVQYDYLIRGIQIFVINTSQKEIFFGDEGVIELYCQAKNEKGKWVDIENRKAAWNCYGKSLALPSNAYYQAVAPCYQGTTSTVMRYKFITGDNEYYSNEFIGEINPGQLTK